MSRPCGVPCARGCSGEVVRQAVHGLTNDAPPRNAGHPRTAGAASGCPFFGYFLWTSKDKIAGSDLARQPRRGEAQGCVEQSNPSPAQRGSEALDFESLAIRNVALAPLRPGVVNYSVFATPVSRAPTLRNTDTPIRIRGARTHNLKNGRPRPAARPADRDHRPVGLGQVLARLRHHLRRGPAPLRRVAVGLRAAVPVDDGEARRRVTSRGCRRRSPSSRSRPPTTRARPSARSPRSTTTCACCTPAPARRAARPRRAARGPDRQPDGRPGAGAARGHALMLLAPVVRDRKGEHAARDGEAARAGLHPRPRRRRGLRARRSAHARPAPQAHHRGGGGPLQGARPTALRLAESFETALKLADGMARSPSWTTPGERRWSSRTASPARSAATASRARAAPVLLQQPGRRLRDLRRPRRAAVLRPRAGGAHPHLSLAGGAIRGWDRRNAYYFQLIRQPGRALRLRRRDAVRAAAGEAGPQGDAVRQRQREASSSLLRRPRRP
jgi:hypothetical protein